MGYLVQLKTNKSVTIQKLFDIIQVLCHEVNFVFLPNTEDKDGNKVSGGLMIKEVNKYKTLLTYLKLEADNFELFKYNSKKSYINIGINLKYLCKFLKSISNYDSLSIAIDEEEQSKLLITLENNDDKKEIKLITSDLDYKPFTVSPVSASYMLTMSSNNFHKYCKDLSIICKKIDIICNGKKLILDGKGDTGEMNFKVKPGENNLTIVRDESEKEDIIVQGKFDLLYLTTFTKCCSFSNTFTIFLNKVSNYPLILQYNVDGLGEIKFVLSQSKSDESYDLY